MSERVTQRPLTPQDAYVESRPLLRHIRIMKRFFEEVIDENPEYREHYSELHCAYMDILNQELAPHALTLAFAVTELEDGYPEIDRKPKVPMPKE